ncbi:MAG TPA: hypothetical protein VK158_02170 [Acidobacteriota bacterium]|nr:hypothetical protein [Acidobacteriota bacterium]
MKNTSISISLICLLFALSACAPLEQPQVNESPVSYACEIDTDCWYTCDKGCANGGWANDHVDTCRSIDAGECKCVNNYCYTDGKPPRIS